MRARHGRQALDGGAGRRHEDGSRGGREAGMRIAIIGTGAMGSVYAGLLADAGLEVWAVDAWAQHVEAIRRDGLRVSGASGDRVARPRATTEARDAGPGVRATAPARDSRDLRGHRAPRGFASRWNFARGNHHLLAPKLDFKRRR